MQKIATKVFIYSSITFGALGLLWVLTAPFGRGETSSNINLVIMRLLMVTVFIILPSLALSVASKYLGSKK